MSPRNSHQTQRDPRPRDARRPVFAAIDLGTNNCRMLVAEASEGGRGNDFRVIDSFSRIVRLGEGLGSNDHLSEAAVERTVDALRVCARKIAEHDVVRARGVATEACRRAGNGAQFLGRVKAETGLSLDAITPDEEAALTVAGCSALLDSEADRAVVFDIGGGSTEISWLERAPNGATRRGGFLSLPYGVVTLAERYGCDCVPPDTFEAMVAVVGADLAAFDKDHGIKERVREGGVQMLGTSGTMTTLGGLYLDLPRYERSKVDGLDMGVETVRHIASLLAGQDRDTRAKHPCIGPGRADLVVAGCAILEAICRLWPAPRLRVADRGIREGLLLSMMDSAREGVPS